MILIIPHLPTGGYSVPQSVISGATTVRRARSVAEMSAHGGSPGGPGHHGSLGGHGQGGGQVKKNRYKNYISKNVILDNFQKK